MCARRFLLVILVLTLIAVAGAFAIYQWGGDVLIKEAQPQGHFQAAAAGSGPNYAEASNWVARPDLTDDPSRWLPGGAEQPDKIGGAAIFYIHPTTYLERDRWNAPLLPGGDSEFRTRLFVQSQASAYSGAGQVWAPRYRQAAFGAFLLDSEDARRALELAYADVDAAFAEFLKSVPKSTPIILAGHSQGALHLEHLLREHGAALKGRIVAAYVAGWPISTAADLPALALPACESPDQAGCILSWMSFGDPPQPDLVLNSYEHSPGFSGAKRKRDDLLCVNPLTGTAGGAAPPEANPGTLVPSTDLRSGTLVAGAVGAHCDKGLLVLDGVIPPLGPFVLPGNNYHVYDYALFWAAIRRDAERRLAAWQKR
jgi:hypothetical protein